MKPLLPAPASDAIELFPIRTVCSLTGVNPVTLRAWERRYGLIAPQRTAGGHRLYTRADIDTIHRIVAAIGSGISVGQVPRDTPASDNPRAAPRSVGRWNEWRNDMAEAIAQFDEARLDRLHNDALSVHSADVVMRHVFVPLLAALGERWRNSDAGIAEEHFLGVYLRNKLGARFHHRSGTAKGPKLIAACLPGEHHEVGLLMFALAAHERGYRVVMLGADVPVGQLAPAARRARADAIVVSCAVPPAPTVMNEQIPALVGAAALPVFVGGPASVGLHDRIVAAGAHPIGDDIDAALTQIKQTLRQHPTDQA